MAIKAKKREEVSWSRCVEVSFSLCDFGRGEAGELNEVGGLNEMGELMR